MESSSVSITFCREPEEEEEEAEIQRAISLDFDTDKNAGKTTFNPGDIAYLRLFLQSSDPYTAEVNMGEAKTSATNIHFSIDDEEVRFANIEFGYLRYRPCNDVSYRWIGKDAGTPLFNGKKITLTQSFVAILNCDYKTEGDRLAVNSDKVGSVLVVVIQGEEQASLVVPFVDEDGDGDGEEPTPVPYELEVKDYCTDAVLAGVTVYFDGVDIGQTDVNGVIVLGALVPGDFHELKMAKAGYMNSEDDRLNNDSFTVPA